MTSAACAGLDADTPPDNRGKVAGAPSRPTAVGFRAPAPSAIGPMHATDTTSLPDLVSHDDDELLLDTESR